MKVLLVLGQALSPTGEVSTSLKEKMQRAIEILGQKPDFTLIITGGVTQPNQPSEAEGAANLLPENLRHRVALEKRAMSTRQNI